MKTDLDKLLDDGLVFIMCASLIVNILIQARALNIERAKVQQLKQSSHEWEQLYRDCQAARQFSEPAHAADAVQPTVTQ